MKAARIVGPQRFELLEVDTPTPKPGEVLVRMEHLAICGSDLLSYERTLPEDQYPLPVGRPCHECVGVVEETLDDRVARGQRVVALTYTGGLVEYAAVPADRVIPVPDRRSDPALWVLCQPLGTVIFACQQIGSVLGSRVVVIGQGPIGVTFTDLLARMGASQVIVSDLYDYRLEAARRAGATHTVNAAREDVTEAVAAITGGAMADIAIQACDGPESANQLFAVLRPRGTAVVFGMPPADQVFPFHWGAMYFKLPTIHVINSARAGEVVGAVQTAVDLVAQGRLDLSYLVSHRLPFKEVGRAYELFSKRQDNALKVLIDV